MVNPNKKLEIRENKLKIKQTRQTIKVQENNMLKLKLTSLALNDDLYDLYLSEK